MNKYGIQKAVEQMRRVFKFTTATMSIFYTFTSEWSFEYFIQLSPSDTSIKNLFSLQDIPNGAPMPHPPVPPTSISGPGSGPPLPPMMNGHGGHLSQNTPLPPMNGGLNGGPPGVGPPGSMIGAIGGPSPSGPSGNLAPLPPMSSGSLPSMVS